jgi:hypothetical protein
VPDDSIAAVLQYPEVIAYLIFFILQEMQVPNPVTIQLSSIPIRNSKKNLQDRITRPSISKSLLSLKSFTGILLSL